MNTFRVGKNWIITGTSLEVNSLSIVTDNEEDVYDLTLSKTPENIEKFANILSELEKYLSVNFYPTKEKIEELIGEI